MNKALYGILATTLVAALKNKSSNKSYAPLGSGNKKASSISQDLMTNQTYLNRRPDALLAMIYSFIDFSGIPYNESLGKISNLSNQEIFLLQQPLFAFKLMSSNSERQVFSKTVESAIVSSFSGDQDLANKMWSEYARPLYLAYEQYFSSCDLGVGYYYIQSGIFPSFVNVEMWRKFFTGSSDSLSLIDFSSDYEDASKLKDLYLSAIIRSESSVSRGEDEISDEIMLGGQFDPVTIFEASSEIFLAFSTSDLTKSTSVMNWTSYSLFSTINSDPDISISEQSINSRNLMVKNPMYVDLVLSGLKWVVSKLISLGQIQDHNVTFEQLYNFWSDPTRGPSKTMIAIQSSLYQNNPMVDIVPMSYRNANDGIMNDLWRANGTAAWSVSSWIIYHLYSILRENPVIGYSDWLFGLQFSTRLFPTLSSSNTLKGTPEFFIGLLTESKEVLTSKETESLINIISVGLPKDSSSKYDAIGFDSPHNYDINEVADLMFDDEVIKVYKSRSNKNGLVEYMGRFLGHCGDVRNDSQVYGVFYMGVPYYTIEVDRSGRMVQFKGFLNRGLGLPTRNDGSITSSKRLLLRESKLFRDDLRNFSKIYGIISSQNAPVSISPSMYVDDGDLFLVDEEDLRKVLPQMSLSESIAMAISRI